MDPKTLPYITLIAGLLLGILVGRYGFSEGVSTTNSQTAVKLQKLQSQVDQAKKFFPPMQQDIRSITGKVTEVRGNTVMLEVAVFNPLDESPRMRTVTVGSGTKIVKSEQKDHAVFQRELAEFTKAMAAQRGTLSRTMPTPPMPFREVAADISQIKPGVQISVIASENIRDKIAFTAQEIKINSAAPMAPPILLAPRPASR